VTSDDELPDIDESHTCHRCGRVCEPLEIQKCPSCLKPFCTYCIYRIGGREYCGRLCGDSTFFGEGDDGEAETEE
jgi:hypothetical protein